MTGTPAGFVKAGLETRDGEWVPAGKKKDGKSFMLNEVKTWISTGLVDVKREKHPAGQVVFIKWRRR